MVQGHPSKASLKKKESLALAQKVHLGNLKIPKVPPTCNTNNAEYLDTNDKSSGDDIECTGWTGGVTHYISSDEDPILISDDEEEEEVEELSGSGLEGAIQQNREGLAGTTTMVELSPVAEATVQPGLKLNGLSAIVEQ